MSLSARQHTDCVLAAAFLSVCLSVRQTLVCAKTTADIIKLFLHLLI